MKSPLPAAGPLLAAIAWTVALIVDSAPYDAIGALLIGIGLLAMAAVSVIGMVAAGARWAHRLALGSIAASLLVAIARPVDIAWLVALALSAGAAAMAFLPSVTRSIRQLPAAAGPPERAVIVSVLLLTAPFAIGIGALDGANASHLVVGLGGLLTSFAYSRVIPGGLILIRFIWPLLALGLAFPMGLFSGPISAGLGLAVLVLAWGKDVKTAFHPPVETGSGYPIPPELTPKEILDAAQIDERGREL